MVNNILKKNKKSKKNYLKKKSKNTYSKKSKNTKKNIKSRTNGGATRNYTIRRRERSRSRDNIPYEERPGFSEIRQDESTSNSGDSTQSDTFMTDTFTEIGNFSENRSNNSSENLTSRSSTPTSLTSLPSYGLLNSVDFIPINDQPSRINRRRRSTWTDEDRLAQQFSRLGTEAPPASSGSESDLITLGNHFDNEARQFQARQSRQTRRQNTPENLQNAANRLLHLQNNQDLLPGPDARDLNGGPLGN